MNMVVLKTGSLHMTEEQFFEFCQENDYLSIERNSSGEIILMEPAGPYTSRLNIKLTTKLEIWSESDGSGYAFNTDVGFTLPNGAIRSPDAAWIKKERYDELSLKEQKKFAHICPDFIIELKSPSDSLTDLKSKMHEWIENGCRLAWLIDPENRRIGIYRSNLSIEERSFNEKISGEDVLPGFELDLRNIPT